MSLPSRECGLKFSIEGVQNLIAKVTPLAGVWIEIAHFRSFPSHSGVTPLAGVWIEIEVKPIILASTLRSLPSRECGLKYGEGLDRSRKIRHSPRGSVD